MHIQVTNHQELNTVTHPEVQQVEGTGFSVLHLMRAADRKVIASIHLAEAEARAMFVDLGRKLGIIHDAESHEEIFSHVPSRTPPAAMVAEAKGTPQSPTGETAGVDAASDQRDPPPPLQPPKAPGTETSLDVANIKPQVDDPAAVKQETTS